MIVETKVRIPAPSQVKHVALSFRPGNDDK